MKSPVLALLLLLLAAVASAQESTNTNTTSAPEAPATPDYSREKLMEIFSYQEVEPERERRIEIGYGWINFRLLGMRWQFSPFFAPLPGSALTTSKQWPDPFALTGAEIAMTPETFRRRREVSAELRRIEKRIRETNKVKVNP